MSLKQEPLPLSSELAALVATAQSDYVAKRPPAGGSTAGGGQSAQPQGGGLDWLVVTSNPSPLSKPPLLRQLYQVGAMGLLIALGLVWVSVRMGCRFGAPLAELERQVNQIGLQELSLNAPFGQYPRRPIPRDPIARPGPRSPAFGGGAICGNQGTTGRLPNPEKRDFDSSKTAILSLDDQLHILEMNRAAERLFGTLPRAVQRPGCAQPGTPERPGAGLAQIRASKGVKTTQFKGPRGVFDAEFRVANFKTGDTQVCTLFIDDISERKHAEARIRYLATHDDLTGLPNRTLIMDRIIQAIRHARRRAGSQLAILYLDLDRFKVLNDGYGHTFGDAVLKAAAERLSALVREGDTVSRQGGDEFYCCSPACTAPLTPT